MLQVNRKIEELWDEIKNLRRQLDVPEKKKLLADAQVDDGRVE